jgi:hypothetical protein
MRDAHSSIRSILGDAIMRRFMLLANYLPSSNIAGRNVLARTPFAPPGAKRSSP